MKPVDLSRGLLHTKGYRLNQIAKREAVVSWRSKK